MGKYLALAPVAFMNSKGEAVSVHRPGVTVEMDDEQAKPLVAAGKLKPVRESGKPDPAVKPKTES